MLIANQTVSNTVGTINYAVPKVFIIQNIIYLRNNVQKHNKLIKRVVI